MRFLISFLAVLGLAPAGGAQSETFNISEIEMNNGVPTPESSKQLFDAMDYYGGVLSYFWSMPAMGLKGWENANVDMGADCPSSGILGQMAA